MFYASKEKKYINEGVAFELNGVQYPANWLNLSSAEEKAQIGLEEVVTTNARGDDKFYWVSEELNGATLTYVNTPKDLVQLKEQQSAQVKQAAYSLLLPSDWRVVKAVETQTRIADDWNQYRADVRAAADAAAFAIDSSATIEELIAAVDAIVWPVSPDAPVIETPSEDIPTA